MSINNSSTLQKLFFPAVILIGSILRFYRLGYRSLWYDEAYQFFEATKELSSIYDPGHPPLSHYILHFFLFFGNSEAILKLPSALFGIATVFMVYHLGKCLYDHKIGLLSAFLTSISPILIYYSQEARGYSQFAFFSVSSLYFTLLIYKNGKLISYLGYIISTILCLYTHFFSLFLLIGENIFILFLWNKKKIKTINWISIQILVLLSFIPGAVLILKMLKDHSITYDYSLLKTIFSTFYIFNFGRVLFPFSINIFVIFLGTVSFSLCFILSLIHLIKHKKDDYFFFISFFLTYILILIVNYRLHALSELFIRYLIFLVPLYLIFISRGINAINNRKLRILLLLVIFSVNLWSLYGYYFNWDKLGKGNFRGASEFVDKQILNPEDVVIHSDYQLPKIFNYYLDIEAREYIIDNQLFNILDFKNTEKVIVVGYSSKNFIDVIKSQSVEADPWTGLELKERLLELGYIKTNEKIWPGKKRIEILVYEKDNTLSPEEL